LTAEFAAVAAKQQLRCSSLVLQPVQCSHYIFSSQALIDFNGTLSQVCTSTMVSDRNLLPSCNWSATKSRLQAWSLTTSRIAELEHKIGQQVVEQCVTTACHH
jgi:hypothetical protein